MFKYPEFLKKEEGKEKEKVETAVLSTTAKVRARVGRKQKNDGGTTAGGATVADEKMSIDAGASPNPNEESKDVPMTDEEKEKKKKEEEDKKPVPEPDT
jgi:26S proteasome regulatory subunit N2